MKRWFFAASCLAAIAVIAPGGTDKVSRSGKTYLAVSRNAVVRLELPDRKGKLPKATLIHRFSWREPIDRVFLIAPEVLLCATVMRVGALDVTHGRWRELPFRPYELRYLLYDPKTGSVAATSALTLPSTLRGIPLRPGAAETQPVLPPDQVYVAWFSGLPLPVKLKGKTLVPADASGSDGNALTISLLGFRNLPRSFEGTLVARTRESVILRDHKAKGLAVCVADRLALRWHRMQTTEKVSSRDVRVFGSQIVIRETKFVPHPPEVSPSPICGTRKPTGKYYLYTCGGPGRTVSWNLPHHLGAEILWCNGEFVLMRWKDRLYRAKISTEGVGRPRPIVRSKAFTEIRLMIPLQPETG